MPAGWKRILAAKRKAATPEERELWDQIGANFEQLDRRVADLDRRVVALERTIRNLTR